MNFNWMRCKVEGRINRARCWEATLRGAISFLIFTLIFGAGLKLVQIVYLAVFKKPLPFDASISYALLFYAGLNMGALEAVTIKRLHDRNKSGWWIVPFFIAPLLLHGLSDWLDNPTFALVVNALAFGLGLWCFVELLCLRGTSGPALTRSRLARRGRTGSLAARLNLCRPASARRPRGLSDGTLNEALSLARGMSGDSTPIKFVA
jgi:uncharacterized membrane protein YhaH (DUF805 family)